MKNGLTIRGLLMDDLEACACPRFPYVRTVHTYTWLPRTSVTVRSMYQRLVEISETVAHGNVEIGIPPYLDYRVTPTTTVASLSRAVPLPLESSWDICSITEETPD